MYWSEIIVSFYVHEAGFMGKNCTEEKNIGGRASFIVTLLLYHLFYHIQIQLLYAAVKNYNSNHKKYLSNWIGV